MLENFLLSHRDEIISRSRARMAARGCPEANDAGLKHGTPLFLDQLGQALHLAGSSATANHEQLTRSAARHGLDLLRLGLTIGQVVHGYGDVCQVITTLAIEQKASVSAEDFRTLNLCLDDAIAEAVTAHAQHRERTAEEQGAERLGLLAHELRRQLDTAMLSFELLKKGQVGLGGSTSLVHDRSLLALRDLIDRSFTRLRLDARVEHRESISVAEFIEELEIGASIQGDARGIQFGATLVDRTVTIEGDRQLLLAAVSALLRNAFLFTHDHSRVSFTTHVTTDRVLFEVEDECGGLGRQKLEHMLRPLTERGTELRHRGLGLSFCLEAARLNAGEFRVRDVPGQGCICTLDLPRRPPPPLVLVG